MRSIAVKSPDGTTIAAYEGGNPAGQAILFIHGQAKGARLSMYDGIGHSTFSEDAPRFNRELVEFVQAIQ